MSHNCHGPNTCHQKKGKISVITRAVASGIHFLVIWLEEVQECKYWVDFKCEETRVGLSAELSEFKEEKKGERSYH